MNKRTLLATTMLATPLAAFGQASSTTATDRPVELPAMVVTAARLPERTVSADAHAGSVSIITRAEIEDSPAFTLQELLRTEVGFTGFDSVGFGVGTSGFGFRGYGEKSGVLVTVDGMRINDGGDGFFLWNLVPLGDIERIEIIRGGGSMIYGEGAVGGVLNIVTKDPSVRATTSGRASFEVGNLGFYQGHVEGIAADERLSFRVGIDRSEWGGWRDASNFRDWTIAGKAGYATSAGRFTLAYTYHTEFSENPGNLTPAQFLANPRQQVGTIFMSDNNVNTAQLAYQHTTEAGWEIDAKLNGRTHENLSTSTAFAPFLTDQSGYGGTLQLGRDHQIGGMDNHVTFGMESLRQDFFQGGAQYDSTTHSGFLKDTLHLNNKTRLVAGARFDSRDTDIVLTFPAFTGSKANQVWSYQFSLDRDLTSASRSWLGWSDTLRLPSANDVVSSFAGFASNPNLVPVKSKTLELGYRNNHWDYLSGEAVLFRSWVDNDIYTEPTFGFGFGGNNNADALRQGLELTLQSRPTKAVSFFLNTALTDARFTSGINDGRRQVLVPEYQISAGMNLNPTRDFTFTLENIYVGRQVRLNDPSNQLPRNAYNVVNAKIAYRWGKIRAFAAVNNLLDRLYEQFPTRQTPGSGGAIRFNPSPGISFRLGASAEF